MNKFDNDYSRNSLNILMGDGVKCSSRGLHYTQVFGQTISHNLNTGFPLSTLRKLPFKNIVRETLWDLRGESRIDNLGPARLFWAHLANEYGHLVGSYGRAWRSYPTVDAENTQSAPGESVYSHDLDQLRRVAVGLKNNPTSRQYVVNTFIPQLANQPCPPCHPLLIFSSDGEWLDLLITARSNDMSIGFSLDFPRYSIICTLFARFAGLKKRNVMFTSANNHVYDNNADLQIEMAKRSPKRLPKLIVQGDENRLPWEYHENDLIIVDYDPHPGIKFNFN